MHDGPEARAALRGWLRRYNTAQVGEAAMIRVWVDATLPDATLRADSAAAFDWGWRRLARFLRRGTSATSTRRPWSCSAC